MGTMSHPFLNGGGEMGELARNYNWADTSPGTPENWPNALRASVSIVLNSRIPMFLVWGPEYIQFYNDAYRSSPGANDKHVAILGTPVKQTRQDLWPLIAPQLAQVMAGGVATWNEEQQLEFYRNGGKESGYRNYSYSPVITDDGTIGGVFITCVETVTEAVQGEGTLQDNFIQAATVSAIAESEARFRAMIEHAPIALGLTRGDDFIFESINDGMLQIIGRADKSEVMGRPMAEILPELQQQPIFAILREVFRTGTTFQGTELEIAVVADGVPQNGYYNITYSRFEDNAGNTYILHMAADVTNQVKARMATEESAAKLSALVGQTPAPTLMLRGDDFIIEHINGPMLEMMGRGAEVLGQPFLDIMPEMEGQYAWEQVQRVYREGVSFDQWEVPVSHMRTGVMQDYYYNVAYRPLVEEGRITGMIQVAIDVTGQVQAKKALKESEADLRNLVSQSPVGICVLDAATLVSEIINDAFTEIAGKPYEAIVGKRYWDTFAEAASYYEAALQGVIDKGEAYHADEVELMLVRHGKEEMVYVTFVYEPMKDMDGMVKKVVIWVLENTRQVAARREIEASEARFRTLLEEAPMATCLFTGPEFTITLANEQMLQSWGKTGVVIGKTLREAMPELKTQPGFFEILDGVFTTGETYRNSQAPAQIEVNGRLDTYYYDYILKALRNEDGEVYAIINTNANVTEQVLARQKIDENQRHLLSSFNDMPLGIALLMGEELTFEMANPFYGMLVGREVDALIGRPLMEAIPELEGQGFDTLLRQVMATGEPFIAQEAPVSLEREGEKVIYVDFTYQPHNGVDGHIAGVLVVCIDVTAQVLARRRVEVSEARFRSLIEEAPVAMSIANSRDCVVEIANDRMFEIWGKTKQEVLGKPVFEAMPEARGQGFEDVLEGIFNTGETFTANEIPILLNRNGKPEQVYLNIVYQPLREGEGNTVTGIIQVATEVTGAVHARKQIEESEARFRSLIEEAPVATCLFTGRELRIAVANNLMLDVWGKSSSVIGTRLEDAVPELKSQPFLDILDEVFTTGKPYAASAARAQMEVDGVLGTYYFNFTYKPLFNETGEVYGIINMALDVTEQVLAQQNLKENEAKLSSIISTAPAAIGLLVGRNLIIENPNQAFIDLTGKDWSMTGKPLHEAMPELVGQPFLKILDDVYTTGVPFAAPAAMAKVMKDGVLCTRYYNISYTPVYNADGEIYAVLDVGIDVTEQIEARQQVEAARVALHSAIEMAELGTWSMEVATGEMTYSDRLKGWLGVDSATQDSSHAPRVHPDDGDRIGAAIRKALEKGGDGHYDEVHTITHATTGTTRFIHASGQAEYDETGKIIRLSGTAQDVTMQRNQQAALEHEVQTRTEQLAESNEELQATVEELAESNAQLTHSNDELAQYAYVASHDLQEPLRKIRVFAGMLAGQAGLSENVRPTVEKINSSAERMSLLIQDLLSFSRLLRSETLMRPVNLMETMQAVAGDFELIVQETSAIIDVSELPTIVAVGLQMNQLFYNLLSNALKFVASGVTPHVKVNTRPVSHEHVAKFIRQPLEFANYYEILFTDNGIGFETQYNEQIFEVFKRLQGRELYPGSGIGLALCRRIVANHQGYLYAESSPGKGSSFHIILPDRQHEGTFERSENYDIPDNFAAN